MNTEKRITKARVRLITDYPFFGRLCSLLKIREDKEGWMPTAGTDGRSLIYNPKFVEQLDDSQILGLLAHEVLHCALKHLWRRGNREPHRWNCAADYAVNIVLGENGLKLPSDGLYDRRYTGLSAEQIYDKLPPTVRVVCKFHGGQGGGDCPCSRSHRAWGDVEGDEEFKKELEKKWDGAMVVAAQKLKGKVPAGMERVFELYQPKENWREILAHYLSSSLSDFDFLRRDRRSLNGDFYIPELSSQDSLEDVVVAVDTSGSIGVSELSRFVSEVRSIIDAFPLVKGWLVDCDTRIGNWRELSGIDKNTRFVGGGGTSFVPVFDKIEERGITPKVVVFFTDGCGDYPSHPPSYPVLWILTNDYDVPFGRKIVLRGKK